MKTDHVEPNRLTTHTFVEGMAIAAQTYGQEMQREHVLAITADRDRFKRLARRWRAVAFVAWLMLLFVFFVVIG